MRGRQRKLSLIFMITLVIFQIWTYQYEIKSPLVPETHLNTDTLDPNGSDYDPYADFNQNIVFSNTTLANSSFVAQFLKGSGTATDPYIFENYNFTIIDREEQILVSFFHINVYFIIRNCHFDHFLQYSGYSNSIGFLIRFSHHLRFENSTFSGFEEDSLVIEDSSNIEIVNCTFENSQYGYLKIERGSSILIEQNIFHKVKGIFLWASNSTIIRNNRFTQMLQVGIGLYSVSYECQVVNNTFSQSDIAIFIGGSKSSSNDSPWKYYGLINCSVRNNSIKYTIDSGIRCHYARNLSIQNNSISYCGNMGIMIAECFTTDIFSNTMHAIGQNGINISSSSDIKLSDNRFSDINLKDINGIYKDLSKSSSELVRGLILGGICIVGVGGFFFLAKYIKKEK